MKKYILVLGFFIAGMNQLNAQYYDNLNFNINDSIKLVASTKSAAKKIDILMNIGYRYEWSKGDSAIIYFKQAEEIAQESKDDLSLLLAYYNISETYSQTIGNYPLALHYATEGLKLGNRANFSESKMRGIYFVLSLSYSYLNNKDLGLMYLIKSFPYNNRVKRTNDNYNASVNSTIVGTT